MNELKQTNLACLYDASYKIGVFFANKNKLTKGKCCIHIKKKLRMFYLYLCDKKQAYIIQQR